MQQQGNSISMDGNEVQRPAAAADTFTWFNLSAGDRPTLAIQLLYATVGRTQNRNTSLSSPRGGGSGMGAPPLPSRPAAHPRWAGNLTVRAVIS